MKLGRSTRWPRFSLRTMFVVVAVFGVWLGWQVNTVHERRAVLDRIGREKEGSAYNCRAGMFGRWDVPTVPFWREWLGDAPVENIILWDHEPFTPSEIEVIRKLFPEAHVYVLPPESK
jgi:hypothetical protein